MTPDRKYRKKCHDGLCSAAALGISAKFYIRRRRNLADLHYRARLVLVEMSSRYRVLNKSPLETEYRPLEVQICNQCHECTDIFSAIRELSSILLITLERHQCSSRENSRADSACRCNVKRSQSHGGAYITPVT